MNPNFGQSRWSAPSNSNNNWDQLNPNNQMPNNNQLQRNSNNQGGNPNNGGSNRWSNNPSGSNSGNSGGNNNQGGNYGGNNNQGGNGSWGNNNQGGSGSWGNRGNNNQGGNGGWSNNQSWNNNQRPSPFAGYHHPTMVRDIPYRGVRQGQVSAQQYRGVAVLYDGTDARDSEAQKQVWDRLTALVEEQFGTPDEGYIWLHESTKRVLLGLDIDQVPSGEFYFTARSGERDGELAVRMLYEEADRIRNLSQAFQQGFPVNSRETRAVLPLGVDNRVGDARTHHFDLDDTFLRLVSVCNLSVQRGSRPQSAPQLAPAPTVQQWSNLPAPPQQYLMPPGYIAWPPPPGFFQHPGGP